MSVKQDKINLIININGDTAKDELNQLRKRSADLKTEMRGLKKESQEWIDKSNELKQIGVRMTELRGQIGLTALSQKELIAELKRLEQMKGILTPQTKEFNALQKEIEAVSKRLKDVKSGSFGFKSFLADIKDEVKQFGTLAAGYLGFEFITDQVKNVIGAQKKLADSMADVRKTTGLTEEQVKSLNGELGKIDTRTTTNDLRQMASVGGQFNVAKEDLLGFVKAADMVNVALGDEFGGNAEAVATDMIKLRNIFSDVKSDKVDKDMLHIANALNELGNAGAATAPVVADFSNRIGGVGIPLGLTSAQVLGLSGTLQELNVNTERGGTAVSKILQKMTTDTGTFATIAGMDVASFTKLVNTDLYGAFVKVVQGSQKTGASAVAMSGLLKDAELSGSGASEVFLKLSQNTDLLGQKVDLAGVALKNTSSIQDEFNVKNNNFAATIDKLAKDFNKMVTSASVTNFVKSATEALGSLLKVIPEVLGFIQRNILALVAWGLAYASHVGWIQKAVFWYRAQAAALTEEAVARRTYLFLVNAEIVATSLLSAAKALLSGNLRRARQEMQMMVAAMATNPLTALLVVVGMLIVAVNELGHSFQKSSAAQKAAADLQMKVNESTADTVSKMQEYVLVATSANTSLDQKKEALQKLIAISPEYLKGLTLENLHHQEGIRILGQYLIKLREKAEQEAASSLRADALRRKMEADRKADRARTDPAFAKEEFNNLHPNSSFTASVAASIQYGKWSGEGNAVAAHYKQEAEDAQKEVNFYGGTIVKAVADNAKATQNTIRTTGAQTVDERKAQLQQEIDQMKAGYGTLAATDAAGQAKARAALKAKEKELAALSPEDKGSDRAAAKEAVAARRQKALEQREENKMQKLRADIEQLRNELDAAAVSEDAKEVARVMNKYADLLQRAKGHFAEEAALTELQKKELDQLLAKQFQERTDKEYQDSLKSLEEYYQKQKAAADTAFSSGEISLAAHTARMRDLEAGEAADRLTITQDYATNSKKAAGDLEKAKEAVTKAGVENRKQLDERSASEALADAERKILTARMGSADELAARKSYLELKAKQEIAAAGDLADKKRLIEQQLQEDLAATDKAFVKQKFDEWMQVAQTMHQAASSLVEGVNNSESAALKREEKANEKKKAGYKDQLDHKRISQKRYDQLTAKADKELDDKKADISRKQAAREKALAVFSIAMNTAQAVMGIWAQVPKFDFGISAGALTAMVVGLGVVQAGMVLSKEPPTGRRGLVVNGPSHEAGGIDMVNTQTGQTIANIEGKEPVLVLNKDTYAANAPVVDELIASSSAGRGARISAMNWYMKPGPQLATARILPQLRKGGTIGQVQAPSWNENSTSTQDNSVVEQLMQQFITEQQLSREEMRQWQSNLKAHVVYRDLQQREIELGRAKSLAGVRQG